ncbi:hypothetical protein [Nocardia terpenica]|uniref:Uncharacterized protein n=1 Tax=Nocardia terpenica TaxID=455432 RepID=A0A6G9Z6W3_9NOCA|nr:hypothetical protein [Nocardia terpenica]QIS21190.1 hypothetical protein F6W96_25565 [Nocardia terpenica]
MRVFSVRRVIAVLLLAAVAVAVAATAAGADSQPGVSVGTGSSAKAGSSDGSTGSSRPESDPTQGEPIERSLAVPSR